MEKVKKELVGTVVSAKNNKTITEQFVLAWLYATRKRLYTESKGTMKQGF